MFLQARMTQRNAFPKGKSREIWLLNVVLAACGQAVSMSCVERWLWSPQPSVEGGVSCGPGTRMETSFVSSVSSLLLAELRVTN